MQPRVVWSEDLLAYEHSAAHPMSPARLQLTMELAADLSVVTASELFSPRVATASELLLVHATDYVDAIRTASDRMRNPVAAGVGQVAGGADGGLDTGPDVGFGDNFGDAFDDDRGGFFEGVRTASENPSAASDATSSDTLTPWGIGTEDNPVFEHMHDASAAIVGATLDACRAVSEGVSPRAFSVAGGMHHAMASRAAGFCIYNDCAVGIAWLLEQGWKRVAYIDIDAHHGDGVQAAFIDDPRVLTVSVHQHPATLWPHTGWSAEAGWGRAEGTSVNLPLLPGVDDAQWLRAFHAVVPSMIREFEPQIIVTQCGVDTHRNDPLADLALTVDGHSAAFAALRDLADTYCEGRWIAVGGGGYDLLDAVPRSWTHLLGCVLDRPVATTTPIPEAWSRRLRERGIAHPLPERMGDDGGVTTFTPWGGGAGDTLSGSAEDKAVARVDAAILDTRRAVFPLVGLDPDDIRD